MNFVVYFFTPLMRKSWGREYYVYSEPNPTPHSSSGSKRRLVLEKPLVLVSFFSSVLPSKPRFLLMSCTEDGKTLKNFSACRFAHDFQQHIGEIESGKGMESSVRSSNG